MEYGHIAMRGKGIFIDAWGAGPYLLTAGGKRYCFEDSDRFGPVLVNPKTGEPTSEMIPARSPFWKAWERWRAEGRKTQAGKPLGTRRHQIDVLYCVHSDLRKDLVPDED